MMKKITLKSLIFSAFCLFLAHGLSGQTIVDFEPAGTSVNFNGFAGAFTNIIGNPVSGGINTSATVCEYNEDPASAGFAGAFSDPLPIAMDFSVYSDVCVKVWAPTTGNMLFKCESPSSGGNWEQLQPINTANTWVELCFDGTQPDQATGGPNAIGRTFSIATVFFDFNLPNPPAVKTWYFDDINMQGTAPPPPSNFDVTFVVNMNGYPAGFGTPYVSGTFNGWSATANPMSDTNGDNIWEATINLAAGQVVYKFQLDGWAQQERFVLGEPCTINNAGNADRVFDVTQDETLPAYCFSTCTVCPTPAVPLVDVTFSVNMTNHTTPFTTVFISGEFNNWSQFDNPLTDADNDGTWETTLTFIEGDAIIYKYQLDGWAQQEMFSLGDPCTYNNFGNADRIYFVGADLPTYCYSTCNICPEFVVPTMGEWALFILALLMVTVGAVFIIGYQSQTELATSGSGSVASTIRQFPFDKSNYFKAMKHAFGLAMVGFAVIYIGWGEIVSADFIGMALTIPLVAYLIHLFYKK